MTPVLVLVGAPGSGKTSTGRRVATRLRVGFRDTDADVERLAGCSISDIFLKEGEVGFRARERAAVKAALAEHDGVLSLGGGAVLNPDTRADLTGLPVAWLDIDLATATRRVGMNQSRPLLVGNVRGRLAELMAERAPLYAEVARWKVQAGDGPPDRVVNELLELMQS